MKDILDRFCPLWSIVHSEGTQCFSDCAFYEAWTTLDDSGVESDGVCVLFNLRFLNWLRPEERGE